MASLALQFRVADAADAPQIQHLVESAFRASDPRQDWTGNAELASHFCLAMDEVQSKLINPDVVTLVAHDASDPAALVASIEVSKRDGAGRLSMIAVDTSHQQGGVGRRVLEHAEDYCRRAWGIDKFSLNALSTRRALIEWYMRRGYEKTGETSRFPAERFPELRLPEDICFVELEKSLKRHNSLPLHRQ